MGNTITPQQYQRLWDTMEINLLRFKEIHNTAQTIIEDNSAYHAVSEIVNIPWYVIAVIHYRESSLNWKRHLHNGDPLTKRTTHVPAGRPLKGEPPFTWEESAVDALTLRGLNKIKDWTIPEILKQLEGYNGYGYQKKAIYSPYLWSGTNHYDMGKYVADGKFDTTVVDKQLGCVAILKELM